eukprot:CAMPEP_0182905700 /NCGR_PEP_ID=MMETSP0034_2-20130328/33154_1 /TAXON_ID=156128 /ORGANISM="Nephroselmis pyriformis, Strain CCMP717" /LENGTH=62 /DNA_ID=CAMNT_0025041179 /DNA_START=24 /DNA_END=210 /DNA_ORIENTATION=+
MWSTVLRTSLARACAGECNDKRLGGPGRDRPWCPCGVAEPPTRDVPAPAAAGADDLGGLDAT